VGRFDPGTKERRLLITETSLASRLVQNNTQSSIGLRDVLLQAFQGGNLAHYMTHREGGFLCSSAPHIAIWSPCSRDCIGRLPTSICDALLFAEEYPGMIGAEPEPSEESEFLWVQTECMAALSEATGEMVLTPEARKVIEVAVASLPHDAGMLAVLKLVKISLTYACFSFDSRRVIAEPHATAAVALFQNSQRILHDCKSVAYVDQIEAVAKRIEETLRTNPRGLSGTEINVLFFGNVNATVLKAAKHKLLREGRAYVDLIPTPGRRREVWRAGSRP
jgi:hypothetical protein